MYLRLRYFYLFLLGIGTIVSTASQECPHLTMKAKIRPHVRRRILAGSRNVKISVTLRSKDPTVGMAFKLLLPRGIAVERTATRPRLERYAAPEIVQNLDGTTAIYWLHVDLSMHRVHRFMAKVQVDKCAPETLSVDAIAYLSNATSMFCTTPIPRPVSIKRTSSKTQAISHLRSDTSPLCQPCGAIYFICPTAEILAK